MPIIVYCGPTCTGKTTHIKENFPNSKVFDIYEYQQQYRGLSYEKALLLHNQSIEDVCKYACEHPDENVVYEQTFLKKKRRDDFLEQVEICGYSGDVILYATDIDETTHTRQLMQRDPKFSEDMALHYARELKEFYEQPTSDEMFAHIYYINGKDTVCIR